MLRLIVGFALIMLTLVAVETFALPLIHELSISAILALPMLDLLKIFEFILFLILLAGFVLQEVVHAVVSRILKEKDHSENNSSRWEDLLYVIVGAFGSGGLYIGVQKISQLF